MIDRSQCPASFHGTYNAYLYRCRCADASEATRLYRKRHRHGLIPPSTMSSLGATRRIRALVRIGHPPALIAERIGRHHKTVQELMRGQQAVVQVETHNRIVALYDELSMTLGLSVRARKMGERRGYAPPLAWDPETIDSPDAQPQGIGPVNRRGRTYADTVSEYQHLTRGGMSFEQAAKALGITPNGLDQALRRAKNLEAA